jgi:hypothetical protein
MSCPGSVRASEGLPDVPTDYAAEGTLAHWVREMCLRYDFEPHDFIGMPATIDGFDFVVDEDMADYLVPGIERVRDLGGKLFVEHRCVLDEWMPGQFGTLDAGVVTPERIYLDDLKFGFVDVDVHRNKQLSIYALGFWHNIARHHTDATDFTITIDQPRSGGIKQWHTTMDELLEFGEELKLAAEKTYDPNAEFKATEKGCPDCPVKDQPGEAGYMTGCRTYDDFIASLIGTDIGNLDAGYFGQLPCKVTAARRWQIVQHADMITKWLARLHDDSVAAARGGNPDPGSKLTPGRRGARKYTNERRAEIVLRHALGDQAFTQKLKSPAQAEKDLKPRKGRPGDPRAWRVLGKLTTQDEGRPVLVSADSPAPALPTVDDLFTED